MLRGQPSYFRRRSGRLQEWRRRTSCWIVTGMCRVGSASNREPFEATTRTMNIGCIGWGSLVWNPDTLPIRGCWFKDGPLLSVEFARHSSRERITLVLVPTVPAVQTLWTLLAATDLLGAMGHLADRESVAKTRDRNIGFWSRTSGVRGTCAEIIGHWALAHNLDAAVWTSLRPKWGGIEGCIPSLPEVLDFVGKQGPESEAAEYIRRTPVQIET